jgi:hypothetical protein
MATIDIAVVNTTTKGDTSATPSTLVYRDSQGGIAAATVQGSKLQTTGSFQGQPSAQTASFTAGAATDYFIDCTAGAVVVTLPLASASSGVVYTFTKTDASGNGFTLTGALGTSTTSTQYASIRTVSNGTNWFGK